MGCIFRIETTGLVLPFNSNSLYWTDIIDTFFRDISQHIKFYDLIVVESLAYLRIGLAAHVSPLPPSFDLCRKMFITYSKRFAHVFRLFFELLHSYCAVHKCSYH